MLKPETGTLIKEVMSRNVITAVKENSLVEICRLMDINHIGSVVIVKDRHPVGIITERDIVNYISKQGRNILNDKTAVAMKTPVFTMQANQSIRKAVDFMVSKHIRRLPIVKNHRLIGIITYGDILKVVQKEIADLNFVTEKLKHEITRDDLTKLANQKFLKSELDKEVERVKRFGGYLSFLMIDVDFFKKINDTYGHDAGDYIIQRVAFLIRNSTRKINSIGRYGGDEYAVIAPISDIEGARRLGERLRELVERTKFHYHDKVIKVTLSVGAASWDSSITDGRGLIIKADKALYKSKHAGRNVVSIL